MEEKKQEEGKVQSAQDTQGATIHPGDLPTKTNFPLTEKVILRKVDQDYGVILRVFSGEFDGKKFEFSVADPFPVQFRQSTIVHPGAGMGMPFPAPKTGRG